MIVLRGESEWKVGKLEAFSVLGSWDLGSEYGTLNDQTDEIQARIYTEMLVTEDCRSNLRRMVISDSDGGSSGDMLDEQRHLLLDT